MRIATWNVNSIKARLGNVTDWLETAAPDVVLLQELKCETAAFPSEAIEALGYTAAVVGQKSYNGVALLSKRPIADVTEGLPGGDDDAQARWVEATVDGDLRIAALYLPNGNPAPGPKYDYKLSWMDRLADRVRDLLAGDRPFVLGGDYNVIPAEIDCYDPAAWADDALFRLDTRRKWRTLLNLGLTDALRAVDAAPGRYTYWDYQGRAWPADNGIRIDHFLLSPGAADRLEDCTVDRDPRGRDKASDHTPVILTLRDACCSTLHREAMGGGPAAGRTGGRFCTGITKTPPGRFFEAATPHRPGGRWGVETNVVQPSIAKRWGVGRPQAGPGGISVTDITKTPPGRFSRSGHPPSSGRTMEG
ncbi:MAG: exodeoxyribonuclease III [Alphaproteobacteria bacterium]|nr:exodeoxyribonuclease III [Alphaproteobacteria bacterium]